MTQKIDLRKFIPSELRNELNTSLTANLFNRFLSEEQSVFVSGQVGKASDPTDAVIHSDIDRELNALVPALHFKSGTEEMVYSFDDMVNRMKALGIDVSNLRDILSEQSLNFAPPIDLDKFINFSNYYWVAKDEIAANAAFAMGWNPSALPEYYQIARPSNTSPVKLPVSIATDRDVTLYGKDRKPEIVTIEFTSPTTFALTGSNGILYVSTANVVNNVAANESIPNIGTLSATKTIFNVFAPDLSDVHSNGHGIGDTQSGTADLLFSFSLTKGAVDFEAGDKFNIAITYLSGSNTVSFTPGASLISANKGFVSNIVPFTDLMYINGIKIKIGDTVLVKNQHNSAENGVYLVTRERWIRTANYSKAENFPVGTRLYIMGGRQAGTTFEVREGISTIDVDDIVFTRVPGNPPLAVNDWQIYNFWVHKDDLAGQSNAVQATRPIIEYDLSIQLNKFVANGLPTDAGHSVLQKKTRFNQIPQFDLYYYDGHHANKTSGIFFYDEDPDFDVDATLLKRLKLTTNSDYVFGVGVRDEEGRTLFFKKNGALSSIWAPGVTSPKVSTIKSNNGGTLDITNVNVLADNQNFSVTFDGSKFAVEGTRSGKIGEFSPSTQFISDEFTLNVTGTFVENDSFSFTISNVAAPRYVKKVDGKVVNTDYSLDVHGEGTWLVPRRMFENMSRTLANEIAYGDLIDHFRSIIKAQDTFEGSSFGINNYRNIPHDAGLGGNIREYSSNFPLLASMLIQDGMSPLSIIDFAQDQYAQALASVDQFLVNELANYIGETAVPSLTSISPSDMEVQQLLEKFASLRKADQTLKDVFADSSAQISNWPITLPMMGVVGKVQPTIKFDPALSFNVIVHHDGHFSPVASRDVEFDRALARTIVKRSNGEQTAGTFAETAPSSPFARQLWFKPSTNQLFVFDVVSDGATAPISGSAGDVWFNKQTNELREWDTQSSTWIISSASVASRWIPIHTDVIRNSLMLAVEQKLFNSVHHETIVKADLHSAMHDELAEIELAKFAAKYGYDTFAPVFNQADAFTWNYKTALGKSRWFDIYENYFLTNCGVATARPDLEPWALLGHPTKPSNWDSIYAGVNGKMWNVQLWNDIKATHPNLKLCVNTETEELLPPYVSSSLPESAEALLTAMPTGIANVYTFLDNGPVENVWSKSLDYLYGLTRVMFKRQPMKFLTSLWGDTYMSTSANSIKMERNLMAPLSPSKFQLHGERLHKIVQRDAKKFFVGGTVVGNATVKAVFEVSHVEDNRTFFYAYINDELKGIIEEGYPFSLSAAGLAFTNVTIDDMGIPFMKGDKFNIQFIATPDPLVVAAPPVNPEDCGCVVVGTNDTLPFPTVTMSSTWTFVPSQVKQLLGFGQLFTNLLRFNYIDTDVSTAINAFRGWDVRLMHRIGALVRGDSLKVTTALGTLPETAYDLIIKRSKNLNSRWISALRIQLVQAGKRESTAQGNYVPIGNGDDWVFRLETYNSNHPVIEYYTYDLTGDYLTFNALRKENTALAWKRYTKRATLSSLTTPVTITGVQNIVNVVFGYIDRLEELGFSSSEHSIIDEETGRKIDWQLEVEKFIDRVYSNLGPGEGHILNPFMASLQLDTPIGLLSQYSESSFIDMAATQAAFDVNGSAIPLNQLFVMRTDESAVTYSDTPMFSAHVFTDEYEHVVLFNAKLSNEIGASTVFDPFLGMRIDTAHLSYTRQAEIDRKPRFNGFVLNGHDVTRNIVSSVDGIANYYDASKTFNEPTSAKHALSVLGFTPKDYFTNLGISDATQFNFWRGLIQSKGTNMSIDAFVNYKKFTDASVDEYWAYKVAEYGDNRMKTLPEIKVEQADCQQSFTQLQFYDATDTSYNALPLFIQIEKEDDARWFSIDDLGSGLAFEALPITAKVSAANVGFYQLNDVFHNGDTSAPVVTKQGLATSGAVMVTANLLKVTVPGNYEISGYTWANPVKQSPVKLFDYQTNTLVKQIALWHPAIGIHAHEPLEIINVISKTDPALYNYSTKTVDNPSIAMLKPWGRKEVGRVWWDTDNLGYVPYHDATFFPNRNERNARWGSLAEWSTIDLMQWTESPVHPSLYDALAADEEGRSDIDVSVRASGKVAKKQIYKRDRSISIRPIAWSKAGVGDSAAHPAFGPSQVKVYSAGGALYLNDGRASNSNLTEDRHFGAWLNNKPVGEVVITDQVVYAVGSSTSLSSPNVSDIEVLKIDNGRLGNFIGAINLSSRVSTDGKNYLTMSDDFGNSQEVEVVWNGTAADVKEIAFTDFGLRVRASGDAPVDQIAHDFVDVFVREGVRVQEIIALPDVVFINDETDMDYLTHDYGWRTWDVPSQTDLDGDLVSPRNTWQPYVGDTISITATADVVKAMGDANLTLKNGIQIKRYSSVWSDWTILSTKKVEKISNGTQIVFDRNFISSTEQLDVNRLSIYANGVQLNPQTYSVSGENGEETISLVNILPEGTTTLLIYRAYQPTAEELAFDPTVKDDVSIQTQYKADYEYTKVDVRNEAGAITSAKYYFWVTDKSIVEPSKSMSLLQAKSILQNGPSQFMMFARLKDGVFDSCVISGLNQLVSNNNTYKLRFTRNNTLRDDPEQLSLKNVHSEWSLIRRSQSSKIPQSLWEQLTNAAAGSDRGGNKLPSSSRVAYDERNGTRTRFGFKQGQIFADTTLVRVSIKNTILNTALKIKLGTTSIPDYITALNFDDSDSWFADETSARATMDLIWSTARPRQINEIFFEVLEDALASNYEFSDIFKTSLISVYSTTKVTEQVEGEITDGQF